MKIVEKPTERTTAATDLLLALVGMGAAVFMTWAGGENNWKAALWGWVFALAAFSGALGALAHGIEMPPGLYTSLWQGINLGLGLAVSLFVVGVMYDLAGPEAGSRLLKVMPAVGIAFYLVTRLFPGSFLVFIFYQAAASLFALAAYTYLAAAGRLPGAGLVAAGILVSLVAAFAQTRKRWRLHLVWEFDHNGLFHLLQAAGLTLMAVGLACPL